MAPASRPPTGMPATSSVSGVTPNANTCPWVVSPIEVRSRSRDPRTAGWSGGYNDQLLAAATRVRARAEALRETSGERVGASASGRRDRRGELYSPLFMRAVDLIRTKRDGGQ